MITHQIIKQQERPKTSPKARYKGEFGSDDHKRYILERSWLHQPYSIGEWVVMAKKHYQIIDIYSHLSLPIQWDHLKPLYIELYDPETQELFLVHPSDIKKVK
jgi:hypothetical protein